MSGEALLNNRYRLTLQQGSGGMAVIYKAIDEELGRVVAVKVLRPSLTPDPTFIARFKNEARSIARLQHPNIVTVYDVGSDGATHYIVMEFIDGQDLKKVIRSHGALGVERSVNLAIQICAGLGYAHRSKLVHADVKPQNILLTKDDVVKITDFGIAQALSDTQPAQRQSVVWGSPHYFAPEQAQGEKPTAASDVYSIGIVMFEMITGRLPYIGANQQELALSHIRDAIPLITEYNPAAPDSLAKIVRKVMSKEPADRYRMADQLMNVLISYRDKSRENTVQTDGVKEDSRTPPPPPKSLPTQSNQAPINIPPPPPKQNPSRPPQEALPTQRYDPAPYAPSSTNYPRPPRVPAASHDSRSFPPQQSATNVPPRTAGDSNPYLSSYNRQAAYEADDSGGLDIVTIVLAIVAFLAVACQCPLWIAVIQARF